MSNQSLNVLLDVPYDYQRDNRTIFNRPDSECQTSSNYMVADYVTKGFITDRAEANNMPAPVNWWAFHCYKRGDTTDGLAHSRVWQEVLGIDSDIKKDGSIDDLIDMLADNKPIALGVHYKSFGHWIVATGVDVPNRMFRCHDPYGSRASCNDWYQSTASTAGKNDYYSFDLMKRLWSCSEYQYRNRLSGEGYGWYRWLPDR